MVVGRCHFEISTVKSCSDSSCQCVVYLGRGRLMRPGHMLDLGGSPFREFITYTRIIESCRESKWKMLGKTVLGEMAALEVNCEVRKVLHPWENS